MSKDKFDEIAKNPNRKYRGDARRLAIFLSVFGIHKFYLGDIKMGILYLMFSWTGIPIFLGFIDYKFLFQMSNDEFNEKYNK